MNDQEIPEIFTSPQSLNRSLSVCESLKTILLAGYRPQVKYQQLKNVAAYCVEKDGVIGHKGIIAEVMKRNEVNK